MNKIQLTQEVIQGFNYKDEANFKQIFYVTYKDMLYFSLSITKDWHESEDIVLKSYIKFWNYSKPITDEKHLQRCLISIVRNESVNYIKSVANRTRKTNQEIDADMFEDESQLLLKLERIKRMHDAIENLPLACKKILKMQLHGSETDEICKELGVTPSTVHSQRNRAVAKLKEFFNL